MLFYARIVRADTRLQRLHAPQTKSSHSHTRPPSRTPTDLHAIYMPYELPQPTPTIAMYNKIFVINFPGTICSGVFCLCLGIPRFSQHDGVRARIGSFVINTIVGVAQAFTLIFCLVGWGWSIWWGMIMLRASSNYKCNLFNFSHLSVSVFCIRKLFGGSAICTRTRSQPEDVFAVWHPRPMMNFPRTPYMFTSGTRI